MIGWTAGLGGTSEADERIGPKSPISQPFVPNLCILFYQHLDRLPRHVQLSLRKDLLQKEFVFLFEYNMGFGKQTKSISQVIYNKYTPDINPVNDILRKGNCGFPGLYLIIFKMLNPKCQQ